MPRRPRTKRNKKLYFLDSQWGYPVTVILNVFHGRICVLYTSHEVSYRYERWCRIRAENNRIRRGLKGTVPARWIRLKVISIERSSYSGEVQRFSEKVAYPPACEIPLLTFNVRVSVVYMARDIMILMRANPFAIRTHKRFSRGGGGRIWIQALFEGLSHGADEGLSNNTTFSQIHFDGQ
jgi:hypothetical protein